MGAKDTLTTRDKTLAIATKLFAERGFHGVSLAQVAQELGLTKQAVLHHFSSKEKLYGEVLTVIAKELEGVISTALNSAATPEAQLEQVFEALHLSSDGARLRTKLLVRELMDVGNRKSDVKTWHLRHFLDQLTTMGRSLDAWADKSDTEVFAALYQLIGAVSYFAISEATLTGMYGRNETRAIKGAFTEELRLLIRAQTHH
ncbi:helix-turn-helix domain-containing protein [Congregibacter brevis]|uniref:Helix-turn-helix domain-containing protein n=1 Tax=Congregibacter brevis TaxID=3081201 RepID=A0ABZ0ID46_9GAMM|nr:helix-turn-helix domain-containing protein [Congregibacter sp. IMCC45268]